MSDKRIVFITVSSQEEARKIARALVTEKLAACVNIIPGVSSIYTWKNELCEDNELLLIAKSSAEKFPALAGRVKSLHSYQTPEVIAMPVVEGAADYLKWMDEALED
ncbi:MAG: divalent-cation tolerance protein CutA [Nitrospinota bacterium]|nr:divalent-cation tolerance protein CutA [Nitrospinota bacterium]